MNAAGSRCVLACVAAAALWCSAPAVAQDARADVSPEVAAARSLSAAFQSVARKLEPSVVHIKQFATQRVRRSFFDAEGVVQRQQVGQGSGVVVTADGYILTNHHVIAGSKDLKVVLSDGRELDARVVGSDELTDIAVLKVDGETLRPAQFADSDALEVGEWVVAIGSPFGLSNTVTAGIVSAKGRSDIRLPNGEGAYQDFIQTDAAVNPGNSGGPLLNLEGKLVGINSAILSRAGGYQGISFAIPANMARAVMDAIIANGRVVRGYLGVAFDEAFGADDLRKLNLAGGARVEQVVDDSPAAEAGLRAGDIVVAFQDRPIENRNRLRNAIALTPPGTEARLRVVRDGESKDLRVRLVDQQAALGFVPIDAVGILARTLSVQDARQLGYRNVRGVLVAQVEEGSLAAASGLEPRDIIVAANGTETLSAQDLRDRLAEADLARGVRLDVIRGNMRGNIVLQR